MKSELDIQKGFEIYHQTKDLALREKLLENYIQLVKQIAGRMVISMPASVMIDDLISSGLMGLVKAIDRFDPAVGVKFETFAIPRIKGAMFDGLREMDWAPRSVRSKARQLENAIQKLTAELGRSPEDDELAQELGLDMDSYIQLLDDTSVVTMHSLDDTITSKQGEMLNLFDLVESETADCPMVGVEREDLKEATIEAIKGLPEQERLVIALYYYEELTLKEIGTVMEISESRVSQIHTKAILSLRAQLETLTTA